MAGLLAYERFVRPVDRDAALGFLSRAEGHPDNVTPALLGGLVVCGTPPVQLAIAPVQIALCVPEVEVSTPSARRALPAHHAHEDVVASLGALALLLAGLVNGDPVALRQGVGDAIHQPYRSPLIGPVSQAFDAAVALGGAPFISGSGSTLAAFVAPTADAGAIAEAMARCFRDRGVAATAMVTTPRSHGAIVR